MRSSVCFILVASMLLGSDCGALDEVAAATPAGRAVPRAATNDGRVSITDDPSIVHSRPLPIDSWTGDESHAVLSVQFSLASPDCTGVHADVNETANSVTVDLREGQHPDTVGRMCTMIVVPATLEVTLMSPLNARTVLSAS